MKLPAVKSPIFRLVEVVEFDVLMSDDGPYPTRLELFEARDDPGWFRARLWQLELMCMQPWFPEDGATGERSLPRSDEFVLLERRHYFSDDLDPNGFRAPSRAAALAKVEASVEKELGLLLGGGGRP